MRPSIWLAAAAIVVVASFGQRLLQAERIEEGHNVFLVGGTGNMLASGLPREAHRLMAAEFDRAYPAESRCNPTLAGCWQGQGRPDRAYAFSADGIFGRPAFSRRVAEIDFSDPVWLRLGFINEVRYNWYSDASDLQRNARQRSLLQVFHPWRLTMPYFVMYRFPAAYTGSELCWQGMVLWEGSNEQFTVLRHDATSCRPLEGDDIGRRIFGVAIGAGANLAMTLEPPITVGMRRIAEDVLKAVGVACVLLLLVRSRRGRLLLPLGLIGLSLVVVILNDASFIGGLRPFDGGDDGLFYDGFGRNILEHLLRGNFALALEGGEKVFFYGGPGLRYFRALEHLIFGESYLGYLSLIVALPFIVLAAFGRFLSARAALALTIVFIAIPIGAVFGTSYFHYVKWAARGFADPAAAILFLAGVIGLIGRNAAGPDARFLPALGAGLLFALALWVRPNLAPGAAVLLGGAGIAALWQGHLIRLAGMVAGFLPAFGMALHNWVFGGVFVLFSSNATLPEALVMPPSAYVSALGELLRLEFSAEHVRRGALQVARWLSGPSESMLMVPLHAAAIAVLLRAGLGRRYDPWLRLLAWSTLALHSVALFYLSADRYHYLSWLLTLLVCAVWMRDEGFDLARRWSPRLAERIEHHPASERVSQMLDRWIACRRV